MSTTYSIVCDECKVRCWVGQNGYIYKYKYIDDFLKEHIGHQLRYLCDLSDDEQSELYEDCPGMYKNELIEEVEEE
jgi:hypothetical protein